MKKFRRKSKGKMLGGVCAGLADYFNVDVSLVRLAMVLLALADGIGILFYILAWIIVPEEDVEEKKPEEGKAEQEGNKNVELIGGIFLVLLGVYFLVKNYLGLFIPFSKIWPVFVIILGIWIIVKGFSKKES
uniref:PspC domain-containing protein n=2 Tax=candidate division WOR-3 bacterium TaxID=2052148 RepID=A0A7V3ZXE8_UNCW3